MGELAWRISHLVRKAIPDVQIQSMNVTASPRTVFCRQREWSCANFDASAGDHESGVIPTLILCVGDGESAVLLTAWRHGLRRCLVLCLWKEADTGARVGAGGGGGRDKLCGRVHHTHGQLRRTLRGNGERYPMTSPALSDDVIGIW